MDGPDHLGDLLWSSSRDGLALLGGGQVLRANPQFERWLGHQLAGRPIAEVVPLEGATWSDLLSGAVPSAIATLSRESEALVCEVRVVQDGKQCVAALHDVTEIRRLTGELTRRAQALEDSLNGYDIVDEQGRIVYVNRAYVEMWGYDDASEVVGMSAADHCANPEIPGRLMEAMRRDGRVTLEFEGLRKDGSTFDVLMSAQTNVDASGRTFFVGTSLDISELRRLRRELTHAAKMEAVGRLAAGVAHDFNNMLSPILGYAEIVLDDDSLPADHRDAMEQVCLAAQRARSITSHLLSISRTRPIAPCPIDLNDAVGELEALLRHAVRDDVTLHVHHAAAPCRVMADPAQLQQVLLNLFNNAVDAMPTGGTITIEVGRRVIDHASDGGQLEVTPGEYGEIVFTDTGAGMDAETRAKVFDAFFSTKGPMGHGLGLASVQGIVKQHGGNVFVYSEVGQGTSFKVYLPLTEQLQPSTSSPARLGSSAQRGHVLLVENDDLVRGVAVRILRRGGLEVTEATSATEAIEFAERDGPPDLLLTDVLLGGMSGRELAEQLHERYGDVPVVFMSGYTENVVLHHGVLDGDVDLIEKPFSASELLNRVRARL